MREERQLTYDASFSYVHSEGISGGWYTVAVTASPETVALAIRACQEALQSLRGAFGVLGDSVQAAKRTLLNKHRADVLTNKHWASMLAGTQCDHIAGNPPLSVTHDRFCEQRLVVLYDTADDVTVCIECVCTAHGS